MSSGRALNPSRAAWMLLLATSFWGASFLLMKALGLCQARLLPETNSWFLASYSLFLRFGAAALILLLWMHRGIGQITRLELWQGAGLGFFGGLGILLQMDGVQYTSASTSAFLTQCYCVFIPVWVAIRERKWPSRALTASCLMVMAGVAVLSDFDWVQFRLGRGELESLLGSVLFTGQILWLERPKFSKNKTGAASLIQFAVIALVMLPVVCLSANSPRDCLVAYSTGPTLGLLSVLTLGCTMVSYVLMNCWQPHIPSTHASLIYSSEPLFTSVFALFLPAVFSPLAHINYPNESLSLQLLIGGGLIFMANILVLQQAAQMPSVAPAGSSEPEPVRVASS